ncbi:hypothetical protein ATANTOWER_004809 [Ataeniobius toweri]|uniref:Uncharacterized protein n=1 Tax=Ataeniobius toweri TaxID=208326 RepID=A0ABU7B7A3_9TELE|nr:hypothetical protein [Ataeniobius toweri]
MFHSKQLQSEPRGLTTPLSQFYYWSFSTDPLFYDPLFEIWGNQLLVAEGAVPILPAERRKSRHQHTRRASHSKLTQIAHFVHKTAGLIFIDTQCAYIFFYY